MINKSIIIVKPTGDETKKYIHQLQPSILFTFLKFDNATDQQNTNQIEKIKVNTIILSHIYDNAPLFVHSMKGVNVGRLNNFVSLR